MTACPHVELFERMLAEVAPYMGTAVAKGRGAFGETWERDYEETLARLFGRNEAALRVAAQAYVRFALDALRLQKAFEKERRYRPKSYDEAARAVYYNKEYMETQYLPGILVSHYLWLHQYRQLRYFLGEFVSRVVRAGGDRFLEVGIGTGLYSRQALGALPTMRGTAFDISEHSLAYARGHMTAFGFADRWHGEIRDVVMDPPKSRWPAVISVEVLEHLEDPLRHLRALRECLEPRGLAFIIGAVTATNEDHIYLYNSSREVALHLEEAGFRILDSREDIAYEPKADEPVPRLAGFVVERG